MSGIYWLASYPKSGNTWFRAFLRNLQDDGRKPADINSLQGHIASSRAWLDDTLGFDTANLTLAELERVRPAVYRWSARQAAPGYHKIHDACTSVGDELLISREGTLGALYIIRNPLAVAPSLANHIGRTVDEAIENMANHRFGFSSQRGGIADQVPQRLLSWSGHVESWADAKQIDCLVIRYEDMQARPMETFTQAARFLRLPLDPARIEKAIRFSDFKVLSRLEAEHGFGERPAAAARFFRSGLAGGWRNELNASQVARIISDHAPVMRRFGYLDEHGNPL